MGLKVYSYKPCDPFSYKCILKVNFKNSGSYKNKVFLIKIKKSIVGSPLI